MYFVIISLKVTPKTNIDVVENPIKNSPKPNGRYTGATKTLN